MDMDMKYQPKGRKGARSKSEIDLKDLVEIYNKLKGTSEEYLEEHLEKFVKDRDDQEEMTLRGIVIYTEQALTLIDDLSIYHGRELQSVRRVYDRLSGSVDLCSEYSDRFILMMDKGIKMINEQVELMEETDRLWQVYVDGGELDSEQIKENKSVLEQMKKDEEMLNDDSTLLKSKSIDEKRKCVRLFEELIKKLEPLVPELS